MADVYRHILTDVETSVYEDMWSLIPADLELGGDHEWSVLKTTLWGGLQDGVELIEVDNGALSFAIVPTRGMGIWKAQYRDILLGWDSPVKGPVHPQFVDLYARGGLGWLYGFDEWIVRCGLDNNGAPGPDVIVDNNGNEAEVDLPLHGRIANLPAQYVEVQVTLEPPYTIRVIGVVDETMMFGPALRLTTCIATELGAPEFTISDTVQNLGDTPAELELLYHCNYGSPILEEGARLVAPIREVAPRDPRAAEDMGTFDHYGPPEPGFVEQAYFFDLLSDEATGETGVLLKNAAGNAASYMKFSKKQLPYFTQWRNTAGSRDGYVTGLEPATNYPNAKRFEREQGRIVSIPSGESYAVQLTVGACDTAERVQEQEAWIQRLQGDTQPIVHAGAIPKFSSIG